MSGIEIQRVDAMADAEGALSNIPRAMGFLLTRLLSHRQGLLRAEYRRGDAEVTWYVRPRSDGVEGEDVEVATLPAGASSSIISRVALTFDIDYTSGGYGRGAMSFEGKRFECRIFLSRCVASGYWIRIYAAAA